MLSRRDMLRTCGSGALALGLSSFPLGWKASAAPGGKKRVLVYTRSAGFEHDVVKIKNGQPSLVDRTWTALAQKHGFEVECTKDGRVFLPETLEKFDAFFFYTSGDLTVEKSADGSAPMPKEGKKALLDAIARGKGFMGAHSANDSFHSPGDRNRNQDSPKVDPYIAMLGGEFISHGKQQKAKVRVINPSFPGIKGLADFELFEEWYANKNFAPDMHVILALDTAGMTDWQYERPAFPSTWARKHDKGRVFYTSMGHRDDVWSNPMFQNLLLGALSWVTKQVDADIPPNLVQATPKANDLPTPPPPQPKAKAKSK